MPAPEQLTVHANGLTFGALAWGDADAPLALLLHGYPDTAWTWRHLGPHLAGRGWRAVAPFTRGYGPTDLAPDDSYVVDRLVDDVLALHTALGGDERAALVGHDWGAVMTWGTSRREPGRFAKHVAMALPPTPAIVRPFTSLKTIGLGLRQAPRSWYFAYNMLPVEGTLDRVIARHWADWSPGYDGTEDVARVLQALDGPGRRRAALRYYRNNLTMGLGQIFRQAPAGPALALHGEQDGCMLADLGSRYPDLLPAGSRYDRLDGVGHFLHLEDPERVNALVGDWLAA